MTLYTALMSNRTDYGWEITSPDGITECYDYVGHAIMEILEENPELLTATVEHMEFTRSEGYANYGTVRVTLAYSATYRGDMKFVLTGYKDIAPDIDSAIILRGYQGKALKDITLDEVSKIANVCKCTPSDVLAHMGF